MDATIVSALTTLVFWLYVFGAIVIVGGAFVLARNANKEISASSGRVMHANAIRTPLGYSFTVIGLLLPVTTLGLANLGVDLGPSLSGMLTGSGVVLSVALILSAVASFGLVKFTDSNDVVSFTEAGEAGKYLGAMLAIQSLIVVAVISVSLIGFRLLGADAPPVRQSTDGARIGVLRAWPAIGTSAESIVRVWGVPDSTSSDRVKFYYRSAAGKHITMELRADSLIALWMEDLR